MGSLTIIQVLQSLPILWRLGHLSFWRSRMLQTTIYPLLLYSHISTSLKQWNYKNIFLSKEYANISLKHPSVKLQLSSSRINEVNWEKWRRSWPRWWRKIEWILIVFPKILWQIAVATTFWVRYKISIPYRFRLRAKNIQKKICWREHLTQFGLQADEKLPKISPTSKINNNCYNSFIF